MQGDLNNDGKRDAADLNLLREVIADFKKFGSGSPLIRSLTPEQLAQFDVNGDGKLNYEDVIELCKHLVDTPTQDETHLADKFAQLREKFRNR
jgi:Ca2+-binding EF-hand superfamily protein